MLKNCGGKLPPGYVDVEPAPPPPPVEDADVMDLSIDFNAVSIEGEVPLNELDESGIERVPMADPGLDVSALSTQISAQWADSRDDQRPFPEVGLDHSPGGTNLHSRRKSALPGEFESVCVLWSRLECLIVVLLVFV